MLTYLATQTLKGLIDWCEVTDDKSSAEILLVGGKPIHLDDFPNLKGIFKTGIGVDNLPFEEAKQRSIQIALPGKSAKEAIFEETANFACHLVLRCLYRNTGDFAAWKKSPRNALNHQTVLVVGTGNIGGRVADKLSKFCRVSTYDSMSNTSDELLRLLPQVDCVSLHVPLTDETHNLFDSAALGILKTGAAIVNTSRGAVINEDALYDELNNGRLYAALDVFWEEPYSGKLQELPADRLLMTPHCASNCDQFVVETAKDFRQFVAELSQQ